MSNKLNCRFCAAARAGRRPPPSARRAISRSSARAPSPRRSPPPARTRLHRAHEPVQPFEPVELVRVADLRRVQRPPQHRDRFVVRLQRHRERMPVLAAVREREARRIGEAARRAVHHLGDQRQRLQRARPEILQQQQRREIAELALVRDRQHRAQPLQIDILRAHIVMRAASPAAAPRRASCPGRSRAIASSASCAGPARPSTRFMIVALRLADDRRCAARDGEIAHRRPSASDSGAPGRCASFMPCCTTAHSPVALTTKVCR